MIGSVLIRDMGVEAEAGIDAIPSVDLISDIAALAGAEELAVRRRGRAGAPQGGNWQPVMRIDDPDQRRLIRLRSDISVGGPDQLVPGYALAGLGHARQPQIGAIGQDGGEKSV